MNWVLENTDTGDTIWEVGAGFGYFSLALAHKAEKVIAFEQSPERVKQLERSIKINKFDNIKVVEGAVGQDVKLDHFSAPDLIIMDIEGAESDVLNSSGSTETLRAAPEWIVELHYGSHYPNANPEPVYSVFNEYGYSLEKLFERSEFDRHILATKPSDH